MTKPARIDPSALRVYSAVLRRSMGIGKTWWFHLMKAGVIPRPHTGQYGNRGWYTAAEAERVVQALNQAGIRGRSRSPRGAQLRHCYIDTHELH